MNLVRGFCAAALLAGLIAAPAGATLHPGDVAPNFTKLDLTNTPVSLSDYQGQVVVLNLLGYS